MTDFTPSTYPPFPEDLPTMDLEIVSLFNLEHGSQDEQSRLFEICKNRGFFYLDLAGSEAECLYSMSEELAQLAGNVFELPLQEKEKYQYSGGAGKTLFGYKVAGATITDRNGTRDTAEFFNISKDDMIASKPSLDWPQPILDHQKLLRDYMTLAHKTGLLILSVLSTKLNLPPDTFANLHRLHEPSGDHVRMTRGPPRKTKEMPEIQTPGHTDFGTITILFNWLGGLQIWSESNRGESGFTNVVDPVGHDAGWDWIAPKPGHAIVNLGDAAVKFTNGLFCSGRHRVLPAPGEQGTLPRYSIVYFVRPEDRAVLNCLESPGIIHPLGRVEEEITARDWIAKQVKALTAESEN